MANSTVKQISLCRLTLLCTFQNNSVFVIFYFYYITWEAKGEGTNMEKPPTTILFLIFNNINNILKLKSMNNN